MGKLNSLRTWFSLDDVAKRLALSFGESVTQLDVLQLVIEGSLAVSWFPGRLTVKPVHKIDGETQYATHGNELLGTWELRPEYRECDEPITTIGTPVRLDLDDPRSPLHEWLRVLQIGTRPEGDEFQITDPNGFYVYVERDETVWRVMEQVPTIAPIDGIKFEGDTYSPRRRAPKRAELIILRTDLELFEERMLSQSVPKDAEIPHVDKFPGDSSQKTKPQNTLRSEATDLRIIGALLAVISKGIPDKSRTGGTIGPAAGFTKENKLIDALEQHFSGFEGLSSRTLQTRFPAAKKLLEE